MRQPLDYQHTLSLATILVNCMMSLLTLLVIYAIASNRLNHPLYLAAILGSFAITLLTYIMVCYHRNSMRLRKRPTKQRSQSI